MKSALIKVDVYRSLSAICPDNSASEDDIQLVVSIMSAGGSCEIVPEALMAAIGALSGSGIAFVSVCRMWKSVTAGCTVPGAFVS